LITVLAKLQMKAELETFSVIFKDASYSEDRWVSEAVSVVEADSHRFPFKSEYFLRNLEKASWYMDQPFNLPNSIGICFLAEKTKPIVTVLLSGEGADELFGGYTRFYFANVRPYARPFMVGLKRLPKVGVAFSNAFNDPADRDPGLWFVKHVAFMDVDGVKRLRPSADLVQVVQRRFEEFEQSKAGNAVDRCLKYDMRTYMVDLLMRQDRMTMAHSIENRVPFLDHQLVEFVRSLPTNLLVGKGVYRKDLLMRNTKILLKQKAEEYFSKEFVYRKKCGFTMPLDQYYKNKDFVVLMEDCLLPGMRDRSWVDADLVEQWWRNADSIVEGNFLIMEQIWSLISLELWAQQFIDRHLPSGLKI
jgi:asparagine synthase (glutamine-hydrolysing)